MTLALILFSGVLLYPTFQSYRFTGKLASFSTPEDSIEYVNSNRQSIQSAQDKQLKLGLDLQGGMHVVLEVDVLGLIEAQARNRDESFDKILLGVKQEIKTNSTPIPTLLSNAFDAEGLRLSRYFYDDLRASNAEITAKLLSESESAVNRAKEIIRNRVDQFGVAEPTITTQGGRRIIVELPGVSDKERVRRLLKGTAKLEFKLVRDNALAFKVLQDVNTYLAKAYQFDSLGAPLPDSLLSVAALAQKRLQDSLSTRPDSLKSQDELKRENPLFALLGVEQNLIYTTEINRVKLQELLTRPDVRRRIPTDFDFAFDARPFSNTEDGLKLYRLYSLKREAELTGKNITEARSTMSIDGSRPEVTMKMDDEGAKIWGRVTGANINKQIAIVLDNTVFSAPVVQSKIANGSSVINGLESMQEASDLEIVLKAGALPAPVMIAEERTVGPSLGADSIRNGMLSLLFGFVTVGLFMIVYYRSAGMIANLALVFNIVFVIAALAGFSATLTLPGIAGLVLTIGMAVDANVLIFERIREESGRGKMMKLAIDLGYDKAFSAILDSHVTTFAAGALLYFFGIGPIKGFAVTLMIGIAVSLFTAIVITKIVLDWIHDREQTSSVSFG
ncbi:MAG: protein translocase subunit SecD [Chloroherpetonaceae bacterium]|nr:protein translocase subunit SecD [Chloroherpetonaceae bacterium]